MRVVAFHDIAEGEEITLSCKPSLIPTASTTHTHPPPFRHRIRSHKSRPSINPSPPLGLHLQL